MGTERDGEGDVGRAGDSSPCRAGGILPSSPGRGGHCRSLPIGYCKERMRAPTGAEQHGSAQVYHPLLSGEFQLKLGCHGNRAPKTELAAAADALSIFNSSATIFWFFFCSDISLISPVPYERYCSGLPLQKVTDREFYLAPAMGTFEKRVPLLYLFSFLMEGGRQRTVLKGFLTNL